LRISRLSERPVAVVVLLQFEAVVEPHALINARVDHVGDDLDFHVQVGLGHERAAVVELDLSLLKRQFSLDDPQLGRQDIEARDAAAVSGGFLHQNHSLTRFLAWDLGTQCLQQSRIAP
jgi:hypothetical protein